MTNVLINIEVVVLHQGQRLESRHCIPASQLVVVLLRGVLAQHGLGGDPSEWVVRHLGVALPLNLPLVASLPMIESAGTILLEVVRVTASEIDLEAEVRLESPCYSLPRAVDEDLQFELSLEATEGIPAVGKGEAARPQLKARLVGRHATVRYYSRMNPDRLYPLLVAITKDAVQPVADQAFDQRSGTFAAAVNTVVEIEPILPGCDCYPPQQSVRIGKDDTKVTFHVVPKVLGVVLAARVAVRHKNRELTEIPLDIRVVGKTTTALLAVATLFLPFIAAVLKHFKVDFESQLQDGFGLYISFARLALKSLTPEALAGTLLVATAAAYAWARPRKRDLFWNLSPVAPEPTDEIVDQARRVSDGGAPEPPADRERTARDKPVSMTWQDAPDSPIGVATWKGVLVKATKRALALGLPPNQLPMNQSGDGSGLRSPHNLQPGLSIETHGSSTRILSLVSAMLKSLGKAKGFLSITTKSGAAVDLPE